MAENIPTGTAIRRDSAVIYTVLMIAGIMDMLLVLYSQANSSGLRCTTPFTSIYMISENKTPTVMAAARITHMSTARDPGLFLYVSQNCSQEPFPVFFIGQPSFLMP